ncbi:hypothetical protein [Streptomyces sp900116325]|uniref:hypothetical protein n=1 Tax=Streptomyces sp. 900116325 TaxID=3154295 RepID=UPI0033EEB2DD
MTFTYPVTEFRSVATPAFLRQPRDNTAAADETEGMDSDSERVDCASRKAAYLAYAEQFKKRLYLCRRAGIQAALAVGKTEREAAQLLSEARRLWSEPVEALELAEVLVRAQGPDAVADSVDKASAKLTDYRAVVNEAIVADVTSREARVRAARTAYGPVYRTYLEFLHAASDSAGDDEVLRLGF